MRELSTIDAYLNLFTTFPRGDVWAKADYLEAYNEQLAESGGAKLTKKYMYDV